MEKKEKKKEKKVEQKSQRVADCSSPFMLEEPLPVRAPLSLGRLTPGSRLTSTSTQAAMLMSVATLLPNAALGVSARVYP